jgi:hypothetical protein
MNKPITEHTIVEIKARLNKGRSMLNADTRKAFNIATAGYCAHNDRTLKNLRKADYIALLSMLAAAYKSQATEGVEAAAEQAFEKKTSPWLVRVRARAAGIRKAGAEVKRLIQESAPAEQIGAAKARVKAAMAIR